MVPPVVVVVHVIDWPTLAEAGHVTAVVSVSGFTVTDADAVAVLALVSVTVTAIVSVPFTVKCVENEDAVAVALVTPLTDHA